jgi:undecaprenyl-diphosphatase
VPSGRSRPVAIHRREAATSILQAIVLGIVQGLTEFAPVSSSGHLILVPWLFHWSILTNESLNKTFDVALHIGTFAGAVIYFWQDIVGYLASWFHSISRRRVDSIDERLAWFLVIGTIPGAVTGALFENVIEEKLGQPWIIAIMLAVFGAVLFVVDRRSRQDRTFRQMRLRDAVVIGVAQAIALQPGVSRSGITITAARGLGFERERAARFSFLLSLPIIGGAGLYKGAKILTGKEHIPHSFYGAFAAGVLAAAVSGFLVIWGLLAYLRRHGFAPFAIYRVAVAAFVLTLIATGVRPARVPQRPAPGQALGQRPATSVAPDASAGAVASATFVRGDVPSVWTSGSRTVKVEPDPRALSTSTVPPWFSATCLTMDNPRPVPPVCRDLALSTR